MLSMSRSRSSHPSSKAHTCLQSQILDRRTPCGSLHHAIKVKFLLFASFAQGFNMTSPHNSFSPQPSYKASTCHQSPILALRILRARLQHAFDVHISLFTSLDQGTTHAFKVKFSIATPLAEGFAMPSKSNSCSSHPSRKAST